MSMLSRPRKGIMFHNVLIGASSRREADENRLVLNPGCTGDAITFPYRNSAANFETNNVMDGNHTVLKMIGEVSPKSVLASLSPSGISPRAPRRDQCSSVSAAELLELFFLAHLPRITWPWTLEASLVYMKTF
jgi:hypothetical protein